MVSKGVKISRQYVLKGMDEKSEHIGFELLGYKKAKVLCNQAQEAPGKNDRRC